MSNKKNTVTANLIDINGDGKIEMISFMNDKGSVGLAVDNTHDGTVDQNVFITANPDFKTQHGTFFFTGATGTITAGAGFAECTVS